MIGSGALKLDLSLLPVSRAPDDVGADWFCDPELVASVCAAAAVFVSVGSSITCKI